MFALLAILLIAHMFLVFILDVSAVIYWLLCNKKTRLYAVIYPGRYMS